MDALPGRTRFRLGQGVSSRASAPGSRPWTGAAEDGVTLAVVNMDMLLGRGGFLDSLRAEGYEIDYP